MLATQYFCKPKTNLKNKIYYFFKSYCHKTYIPVGKGNVEGAGTSKVLNKIMQMNNIIWWEVIRAIEKNKKWKR